MSFAGLSVLTKQKHNRRTNRPTDGQTYRQMDGRTHPFRIEILIAKADGPIDLSGNQPADRPLSTS